MAGDSGSDLPLLPVDGVDRTGVPFRVRPLEAEDRARLEAFYLDFEPKRAAQGLPPAGADRLRKWLDAVLRAGIHLVVVREGSIVGHALLIPMDEDTLEYAIWLHQDVRHRGIGTAVNRIAIEAAREAGWSRIWLSVEPSNRAAVCSYLAAGFELVPGTALTLEAEMVRRLDL